ncbi:c-type cytochrome [Rhodovulum sp. DZ06]|uniref:c-type cytochrome n=1 Tax=Rhodovulum sp. DZ06 TaxID=3425126 RepID=UPI003D347788
MQTRLVAAALLLAAGGAGAGWVLSAPDPLPGARFAGPAMTRTGPDGLPAAAPDFTPDPERGATLFAVAGCASCHIAPAGEAGGEGAGEGAEPDAPPRLAGGKRFETAFGTFVAPNISPHETDGIGAWSSRQFADAVLRGIGPEGAHLYPAFPYASYAKLTVGDALDMFAYLGTLPPVEGAAPGHELGFPFNIRRGLGLWKRLYLSGEWVVAAEDPQVTRGRFLVEGPGHCAECHTPRDPLGGLDRSRWLAGAPNPDGPGQVPDITPRGLSWSEADIAYYLESGFTPDYDSVGGSMVEVVENLAALPPEDRAAIAAYLKAVPTPAE